MRKAPTLGRELITALVVVFAGAILLAAVGVLLLLPRFRTPADATVYIALLVAADVAVLALFGHYLVRRRVVAPLERVVAEVEEIARGDYERRLAPGEAQEVRRLSEAVNGMAERLITHQQQLAANVRSLEETNRQLTEARDELVRVEKMASVGRMAAGIAHEIGNPLGAILGYLAVLRRGADAKRAELLTAAEAESRRIDRIVHGLLDYARPRGARSRSIDINMVVDQTVDLVRTQGKLSDVQLELDLEAALPTVVADFNQLQQVLVNLIINALDAMDGTIGSTLRIATATERVKPGPMLPPRRKDDPPDLDYSHRRRFNRRVRVPREDVFPSDIQVVSLAISDTGPGIDAEHLDQIFEPFFTTKEPGKGTGLGLAVAARLVDAMGGTIRVETEKGRGTTFLIYLPPESATAEMEEGTETFSAAGS